MKKDAVKGKLKVVQDILAFKASCDGFPNLKLFNSLPSLNKLLDTIAFLMDLIKSVVGLDALKDKSPELHEIIIQKFYYRMTNKEIGEANGYGKEAARKKLKKALDLCRELCIV